MLSSSRSSRARSTALPSGSPDCDASGALNVNDAIRFQTRFALGCSAVSRCRGRADEACVN